MCALFSCVVCLSDLDYFTSPHWTIYTSMKASWRPAHDEMAFFRWHLSSLRAPLRSCWPWLKTSWPTDRQTNTSVIYRYILLWSQDTEENLISFFLSKLWFLYLFLVIHSVIIGKTRVSVLNNFKYLPKYCNYVHAGQREPHVQSKDFSEDTSEKG